MHLSLAIEAIAKLNKPDGATFEEIWNFASDKIIYSETKKNAFEKRLRKNVERGNLIEVSNVQDKERFTINDTFCKDTYLKHLEQGDSFFVSEQQAMLAKTQVKEEEKQEEQEKKVGVKTSNQLFVESQMKEGLKIVMTGGKRKLFHPKIVIIFKEEFENSPHNNVTYKRLASQTGLD